MIASPREHISLQSVIPLQVKRIHHLSRTTNNVQRLVDFYVYVMGFTEKPRPKYSNKGAWLQLGDLELHVLERSNEWVLHEDPFNNNGRVRSSPQALTRGHHLAFLTDDFEKTKRKLNKMGIDYYESDEGKMFDIDQLWFFDPDGNGIEIITPRTNAVQKCKL